MTTTSQTNWACITLDENNLPRADDYGDLYFSNLNGLEETRYVFLDGNHLTERFKSLANHGSFYILETGFGTGLNFLAVWQLWESFAPKNAKLYFHSFEKHPIHPDEFRNMLRFTDIQDLYDKLYRIYPKALSGQGAHVTDSVVLQLHLGDIRDVIPTLQNLKVDAFFLDGFSPAKNPDMWCETVYRNLARLAAPQATLATFTAAGHVRQGLAEEGFTMSKRKGFGYKRHMSVGVIER